MNSKFKIGELVKENIRTAVVMKVTGFKSGNEVNCKWKLECKEYTGVFNADNLISVHHDDRIITKIITSFRDFAFNDLNIFVEKNWPVGGFILGSCLIDQLSNYAYGTKSNKNFEHFVKDYLPLKYHDIKLYDDLRNKLVHNYSIGEKYLLVSGRSDLHFEPNGCQFYLNLNDFVNDLAKAFECLRVQLITDPIIRENAFNWHSMDNEIIGKSEN